MTTINKIEIEKFSKLSKDWWNPNGKFKPLHLFNPTRISFIKKRLIEHFNLNTNAQKPLDKINILDVGCGGGLICEPLTRLGASITGIDASESNIKIAKLHAEEMNLNISYIHTSPEKIQLNKKFDVILNMEVVEHVENLDLFIQNCSELLKSNGIMFIATINKNLKSYLFAIIGAEYILRWLPIGTHDWDNFLKPQELEIITSKNNLKISETVGMKYDLLSKIWKLSNDTSVNYISTFIKT